MICCVTGHRSSGFGFPREDIHPLYMDYRSKLADEVENLINSGYGIFITGMAEGADMDFANMVIMYRKIYKDILLEAALPYPVRPTKIMTPYYENRDFILKMCDETHIVSDHYFRGCMDIRNRFMVDRADMVFAIWNGESKGGTWNTIKYARSKGKPIRYLMLNELNNFGMTSD